MSRITPCLWFKDQAEEAAREAMDMGPMGTYQMFAMEPAPEGATCGGLMNDPQAARPYWLFYVHVDDIDAAIGRVKDNGGTIVMGPDEVPGGVWIVNAIDPQGALFALVGSRK